MNLTKMKTLKKKSKDTVKTRKGKPKMENICGTYFKEIVSGIYIKHNSIIC